MKFATSDKAYLTKRRAFSEKTGPRELWSTVDQWPLYCGIANLARFMAIADLFRSTLDVPGHVAEFGTWRGANLMFLAKLLRVFDPHSMKVIHSFDSFEGLSEFKREDSVAIQNKGGYRGSLQELREMIDLYDLQDEVSLHVGLIEEMLPPLLKQEAALRFSFVYCDTDLYQSTRLILDLLHPRVMKGGVMIFDQWNWSGYPGEGVAVAEFLEKHGDHYSVEHIKNARQPTLCLRKLT